MSLLEATVLPLREQVIGTLRCEKSLPDEDLAAREEQRRVDIAAEDVCLSIAIICTYVGDYK
jgi:hypothetical protein